MHTDIQTVSDCVNPDILLPQLIFHGTGDKALTLYRSYPTLSYQQSCTIQYSTSSYFITAHRPYFVQRSSPQNMNFTGEARMWFRFT
jgi:hypothetical protein